MFEKEIIGLYKHTEKGWIYKEGVPTMVHPFILK